jgi:hypothetical protein
MIASALHNNRSMYILHWRYRDTRAGEKAGVQVRRHLEFMIASRKLNNASNNKKQLALA